MEKIVSKFGGSSVLEFEQIARIVQSDSARKWVVLSAPGDSDKQFRVTQMLIRLANTTRTNPHASEQKSTESTSELKERIITKYTSIFGSSTKSHVETELDERLNRLDLNFNPYLANLKAFGEDMTARLAASALNYQYTNLKNIMQVHGTFAGAQVLPSSYELMKEQLGSGNFVIPGFFGYGLDGLVRTFAFGGSDKTGAEIARGLRADLYENFTDSPVRSADPNIVPNAKIIPEMTHTELRDLSYAGFGIYHSEAISPLLEDHIPIHVRSTKDFPGEGTWIRSDRVSQIDQPVIGVAYREGLCGFSIAKTGLNDIVGVLSNTASALRDEGISVEFPAVGIDDISYVTSQDGVTGQKLDRVRKKILNATYGGVLTFYDNLGCVGIAGKGIDRGSLGVSSRANNALQKTHISVYATSMGIERRCILYALTMQQGPTALRALYDEFIR